MDPGGDRLEYLARRIADGDEIDWEAEAADSDEPGLLNGMRALAELAAAHRMLLAPENFELPAEDRE